MAPRSFLLDDAMSSYLDAHRPPPDPVAARLIAETAALGGAAGMQIGVDQGMFMQLLASLSGARRAVEVGTFTGYSALCVARGMGPDGRLLCCDVSEEWTSVARRYWAEAGVAARIELRLGAAGDTLAALPVEPLWDLAFIDADKPGYPDYWEKIVVRMRPGGLILVDNVLWGGSVADPDATDSGTAAMKSFNDLVAADDRVEAMIMPIGDGLTVARTHPAP
ncbi:O-methyltransferase [Acidiferrimicrobium sp. IK]|uniref:O-methyltransferase n=1 Tax=Acidiferrimicrobium sp. IK TaxID=2871700 RepID=UPI0021CB88C0|nr:O-methyltransferase [Acidiferrimicrobium sp. IK]MCU4185421.1 O-methyltransferase [Acidiferrimicrobium sp. IK]